MDRSSTKSDDRAFTTGEQTEVMADSDEVTVVDSSAAVDDEVTVIAEETELQQQPHGDEVPEVDWDAITEREEWKQASNKMLYGALWCIGGTAVTLWTYNSAVNAGGGRYWVAWGAMLYGLVQFLFGLSYRMSHDKPELGGDVAQMMSGIAGTGSNTDNNIDSAKHLADDRRRSYWIWGAIGVIFIGIVGIWLFGGNADKAYEQDIFKEREQQVMDRYNQPKYELVEAMLQDGEVTDGRIVVREPANAKMTKTPLDPSLPQGDYALTFNSKATGKFEVIVTSTTEQQTAVTDQEFNEIHAKWKPDWAKSWKGTTLLDDVTRNDKGHDIRRRTVRLTKAGMTDVTWDFALVYDPKTQKVCLIVAFQSQGAKAPTDEILKSLKFYNIETL